MAIFIVISRCTKFELPPGFLLGNHELDKKMVI